MLVGDTPSDYAASNPSSLLRFDCLSILQSSPMVYSTCCTELSKLTLRDDLSREVFQQLQSTPYSLKRVRSVLDFLGQLKCLSDDEIYAQSLLREPRKKK